MPNAADAGRSDGAASGIGGTGSESDGSEMPRTGGKCRLRIFPALPEPCPHRQ